MSAGKGERAASIAPARLGYLLSKYPSANHTYLLREVRALRQAGFDVEVVAVDGDDRLETALTAEECEERARTFVVKWAGLQHVLWAHLATALLRPVGYAAGLAAAVRLAGPDLSRLPYHLFYFAEAVVAGRHFRAAGCTHVHTHYATTVALLAARIFPLGISATIHGSAEFIEPRAQRLREKVAACSFVRAISLYGRSQLMYATPPDEWHKFVVTRLGVDPGGFRPAAPRSSGETFRLVSVGQLQPAKGFPVLLDALAMLVHEQQLDVELTIVGGGGERAGLEAQAARLGIGGQVIFTGPLNQTEVREALRLADCFVLASFAEGVPVVLMEAMACNLPCVATRITGIPELIEDGVSGLLVTPSDVAGLAAALARLAQDSGLRHRVGAEARARIVRDYNLGSNAQDLARLFAEIGGAATLTVEHRNPPPRARRARY